MAYLRLQSWTIDMLSSIDTFPWCETVNSISDWNLAAFFEAFFVYLCMLDYFEDYLTVIAGSWFVYDAFVVFRVHKEKKKELNKCNDCGKIFMTRSGLSKHIRYVQCWTKNRIISNVVYSTVVNRRITVLLNIAIIHKFYRLQ